MPAVQSAPPISGLASVSIEDRRLARIIQRCQTLPGEELFQYVEADGRRQTVDSGDINAYLRVIAGETVTAKDFRTWAGTVLSARELRDIGTAHRVRTKKLNVANAVDRVAARLGNTRAVCRKYSIHPVIIAGYMRGRVIGSAGQREPERTGGVGRLRSDEGAVLRFIHEHQG